MRYKIKRFFRAIIRAIRYAIHGFQSENWDTVYLLDDIVFKLKQMEKYLFNNSIAQHDRITKKSLRRTIELGEILTSNTSRDRNFFKNSDKMVDLKSDINRGIARTITPEYKLAMKLQHEQDKYNYDMFFTLLKKYSHYWWD